MAPEVLNQSYGPEADIWSAGVVMYIVLSGIPPFWASSRHTVAECIMKKDVSFRSAKWANVSEECIDLIGRMLIKDPKQRISATEILGMSACARYHPTGASHLQFAKHNATFQIFCKSKHACAVF